jgi:signal peptidase II
MPTHPNQNQNDPTRQANETRASDRKSRRREAANNQPLRLVSLWIPLLMFALIILDQLTKYLVVLHLKDRSPVELLPGILELQYLENRGAAWGMLQNRQWFFWIITLAFLVVIGLFMTRMPKTIYYRPLFLTLAVLASGALGNFIDRVRQAYVVDFIYFRAINFPIFNVADIYVTLSVIALLILILFHYQDEDFRFMRRTHRKEED